MERYRSVAHCGDVADDSATRPDCFAHLIREGAMTPHRASRWTLAVGQNARIAARAIARRPQASAALVLVSALGIAGAGLVLATVGSLVLRTPGVVDPAQLYVLSDALGVQCAPECVDAVRPVDLQSWRVGASDDRVRYGSAWSLAVSAQERQGATVRLAVVDSEFQAVARMRVVQTNAGRGTGRDDPRAEIARTQLRTGSVAIASFRFWRESLGSQAVGAGIPVRTSTGVFTVMAVAAPEFDFPARTDLWVPSASISNAPAFRERALHVLVRASSGIDSARVAQQLLLRSRHRTGEDSASDSHVAVVTPVGAQRLSLRSPVGLAGGVGLLVFLTLLVNVAVLATIRAVPRLRDTNVRAALGASRIQLVAPLVADGLLLALCSATLGIFLTLGMRPVVERVLTARLATTVSLPMDARFVVLLGSLSTLIALVLIGLPVLMGLRTLGRGSLRSGAATRDGRAGAHLREAAVAVQIGVSYCLAMGALAFTLSFLASRRVDLGFDARNLALAEISLDAANARDGGSTGRLAEAQMISARESLRDLADERGGALWAETFPRAPLRDGRRRFYVDGRAALRWSELPGSVVYTTSRFFSVFRSRVLQRNPDFDRGSWDRGSAVVNRTAASLWWPGQNALGQRIRVVEEHAESEWLTVAAVIEDQYTSDLALRLSLHRQVRLPMVYVPLSTAVASTYKLAVQTGNASEQTSTRLEQDVRGALPFGASVVVTPRYLDRLLRAGGFDQSRRTAQLLGVAAGVIVLISLLGIAAAVTELIAARRRDLAIRLALGAPPRLLVRQVTGRMLSLAACSIGIGVLIMLAVQRVISTMMVTLRPPSSAVYLVGATTMLAICAAAALCGGGRLRHIRLAETLRAD